MVVHVHGFDWLIYAEHVMPAFASWFIDGDESAVYQLFEQTRCMREEQFLPDPMQRLRVWPRAQAFIKTLPHGPQSRREYSKLCSAEHFTALSDRYIRPIYNHGYTPQLYTNSDAIRSIWGAIVEEYCLPWDDNPLGHFLPPHEERQESEALPAEQVVRSELVSLLQAAGLGELAKEVGEQAAPVERFDWEPAKARSQKEGVNELHLEEDLENLTLMPKGISIGRHPNTLPLRGWLAGISIRAMVLFEYLACGRRAMPFGFEAGEPFGVYIGYLTPDEVWQLALCLQDVKPPTLAEAEEDYLDFRLQYAGAPHAFRLVDEVLPAHAAEFLKAVRLAAFQGLGLIASVE